MIKLNPIRQIVQKTEEKLYLEIPVSAAELLGIHEGDIVQFLPEKVISRETISEKIGSPKLNLPLVNPNDIRGFSERLKPSKVKELFLQKISKYGIRKIKGKNSVYDIGSRCRIYLKYSKYLTYNPAAPYFFGLDPDVIQEFNNDANKRFFIVFVAENENNVYIFPWEDFEGWLTGVSPASKDNNFKMTYTPDLKLRLTGKEPIDISRYLNNFELFDCNQNYELLESEKIIGSQEIKPLIIIPKRDDLTSGKIDESEKKKERPMKMNIGPNFYEIRYSNEILINTANWLIENDMLKKSDCPISAGTIRNLINVEPMHKNEGKGKSGQKFRSPKTLSNGLFIETSYTTENCINCARKLLKKYSNNRHTLEVDFK